jgi:hypothetical protein
MFIVFMNLCVKSFSFVLRIYEHKKVWENLIFYLIFNEINTFFSSSVVVQTKNDLKKIES